MLEEPVTSHITGNFLTHTGGKWPEHVSGALSKHGALG